MKVAKRRRRLQRRTLDPGPLGLYVVLNLGMGVESCAMLVRWLLEPETRWFPLRKLIVLTAQVGAESKRTRWYMEYVIYPLLRRFCVRTVQVARAGPRSSDGIVVLDDTRRPTTCHTEGRYTLQDELLSNGTVPQYASGKRRCSLKYKGEVLDRWLDRTLGRRHFTQVMGFNAEEQERIQRDHSYSTRSRAVRHPLAEWGWNRQRCEDFLLKATGVAGSKSACSYCPFSGGREHLLERFRDDPEEAALALLVEFVSVALNPRMTLFKNRSLQSVIEADGNEIALAHFLQTLQDQPWALYEVRRVFYAPGVADRKVEAVSTGSYADMVAALGQRAAEQLVPATVEADGPFRRVYLRRRPESGESYPQVEHLLTVAPATVQDKSRKRFSAAWASAINPFYHQQAFL